MPTCQQGGAVTSHTCAAPYYMLGVVAAYECSTHQKRMQMFCRKCGKEISDGMRFCDSCGTNIDVVVEANMKSEISSAVTQDSKNIALITWVGTIFFGFIPGLIFYLIKKDDPYIQDQAKEALNWSITAIVGYFASLILTLILIGILGFFVVGICHLVFCVMGAIAASDGKTFRVPYAIRLIK